MRSRTTYDPDFTDADRASAFDWQTQKALTCRCGHPLDETTGSDRESAYDAELWICHACAASDRELEMHRREGGSMAGVYTRTREVD